MAISTTIGLESLPWEYDVFLSFRGEDTRKTFTDHLYSALRNAGIHTFRDEEGLRKGEYLAPELTRAIQSSRIAMIVFSKDYASSRWCLDELVQIVECKEKGKLIVFPVFYDVEPSEVRKQSGNYGIAFTEHERRFQGSDRLQKWRDALTQVADMSGWDLRGVANGYESNLIDSIIKKVKLEVRHVPMFVVEHEVGLESRVEHVAKLLLGEPNDGVPIIGIYGMGGIGKTTLAKAVYNRLFGYFESSCFLEIDSAISGEQDNGINLEKVDNQIKKLQKQLFQKLFNEEIKDDSIDEGIMQMKRRLQAKKCLIVLDNLEHRNQFNKLCGGRDWFGGGSRLILTTREVHVLKNLKEDEHFEVEVLNREESLRLFTLHAFREPTLPKEVDVEVLGGIVAYCEGLPLALEVLGAYLYDKSMEEWVSAFEKLKGIPHHDVQSKLKISYDGLPDDHTKSLFLDLVCFNNNELFKERIDSMWDFSTIGIRDLADKCLIKCMRSHICMHSLIQDMGREIIRLESPNDPSERSRLRCPCDIHDVLIGDKGTKKIEVIVFNDSSYVKNRKYNTKSFKNMENLRFLQIHGVHLDGNFEHLPKVLRCLQWNSCPLKYINISSNCFYYEKLVRLEMQRSKIKEFQVPLKYFSCLKHLDLSWSRHLTRTPNFSGAKNICWLSFNCCSSLAEVQFSIGELRRLVYLDFRWCEKLNKLPNSLCHLSSLQKLVLGHTNIYGLPSDLSHLSGLQSIHLEWCKKLQVLPKLADTVADVLLNGCVNLKMITHFPPYITNIGLRDCKNLNLLPQLPPCVRDICLSACKNLEMLPQLPPELEHIKLDGCQSLNILPDLPPKLRTIILDGCKNIKILPELPRQLEILRAKNCESMEKVSSNLSDCARLQMLDLGGCRKLKGIQGWENLQSPRKISLEGVHHIDFSHIKKVLIGSKLDLEFKCTDNEIPSWIRCKEEGSSISFRWPLCNNWENYISEFLGIIVSVELKARALRGSDWVIIQINGFSVEIWINGIQLEVDNISFFHLIPSHTLTLHTGFREDIKAGKVMKVTSITGSTLSSGKASVVKKIGVGALYRDTDGFKQFVPITKVG